MAVDFVDFRSDFVREHRIMQFRADRGAGLGVGLGLHYRQRAGKEPAADSNLQSFLGLASYYRRYMRNFTTIARPLHHLTDRGQPYVWDDPCVQAFNTLRTALITAPVLAYPDTNRPFILDMDASNVGVGAILSQPSDSGEQVIAYYSCALNKTEWNYCVTRRELLAVIAALRHFRPYLHVTRFLVRTDHASLTWLMNFKNPGGQVQEALVHVQSWLAAGKRPEWADVAALDTETRAYHSQWAGLEVRDGVLYRRWRALGRGADLLQLRSHGLQPRRQVSRPDPFPPETLLVCLWETGGEHRSGEEHPHI
ncbi:hypothetical protein AAFF_G00089810 [Aldrovandia affinis]|uniref:Reverse transcriptase/retrotransposon-derived protein RNase H-like domain-containing protein n=1 Tax=Aldrovandia affinis TaxID=143900 RepID=A0AAD7RVU0_9TELE|nr:hypothetical protein AAFF_G00089810 [Aldrovandia affinis]